MKYSLLRTSFFLLTCLLFLNGTAQNEQFPLKGKHVAVYFSKKQFTFDDNYRIPLSQFILTDEGRDAEIEDIKVQTLIALGSMFSQQLKTPTEADSIYFLNEQPKLGNEFIQHYNSDSHELEPLGSAFESIDYVLVINPFILGSYKTSSVYSRSNRIITEQVVVKTARLQFDLYNPKTGALKYQFETCVDDRKTKVEKLFFEFHMEYSITGRFLSKLFSAAVEHLNTGKGFSCTD